MVKFIKGRTGSSIIEFAIGAPVFLLFMFGIMEMGFILWNLTSLNFAVSQAARYAYVTPNVTQDAIISYAKAQITPISNVTISATVVSKSYADITGTVPYTFVFLPLSSMTLQASIHQPLPKS